jgi:lipoate-protein ligase B
MVMQEQNVTKNNRNYPEVDTALVCLLGLVSFPDAMAVEHWLIKLRHEEKISDTLLIFEHPPTITLGKFGNMKSVLASSEELAMKGIRLFDSDRGGDATYNCPGQLVIHPIVNLRLKGVRAHIADLEEVCLRVIRGYGIAAERSAQHPGIWVEDRQICAVGLRFSRGISMHGVSLNVNPDLDSFRVINLCGLPGKMATSIESELGHAVSIDEVKEKIQQAYADVFRVRLQPISRERLLEICEVLPASEILDGETA